MFTKFENHAVACVCLHILLFRNPGGEHVTHQMPGLEEGLEITLLLSRKLSSQRANSSFKCPSPAGSRAGQMPVWKTAQPSTSPRRPQVISASLSVLLCLCCFLRPEIVSFLSSAVFLKPSTVPGPKKMLSHSYYWLFVLYLCLIKYFQILLLSIFKL